MPARRNSSDTGQAPSNEPEAKGTPAGDRRRSIPRPNLEAASKLKTYVGNALDTASRGPAWLASKAVPVAADGAGLFRSAAADAADRVALFRRSKHYDELEEEPDEDMRRRTMHLSSADATPERLPTAAQQHRRSSGQEHERQDTGSQQDVSDSVSMHSPGDSEASSVAQSAKSGRGGLLREEPAMISFEDEIPPMPSSRSTAEPGRAERSNRPSSASSSLSVATSDLLSDHLAASHPAGSWAASSAQRSPAPALRPPAASTPHRANSADARLKLGEASPSARGTPVMGSPAGSFKRGLPQAQPHPFLLYEASRGLKNQQSSDAADKGTGDASAGSGRANGVYHLGPGEECGAMTEQRSASLQPLIGKAAVNGGPPKATRLKPCRPPPPPPTSADLDGAATRSVASRQSSASSLRSAPEKGALRRTTSEDPEPKDSWDIFEPRVAAPQSAPADSSTLEHKGGGCDLKELKHMTGKQLLQSLAKGSAVRKKWVTHLRPAEIAAAARTTRTVRCVVKDGKAVLQYSHQGVKGLTNREEVSAAVQRVEVPGGNWHYGATILVYTSRGVLALEPIGPAAYSQWVLGLNAALVACQTRRKDVVYGCAAHLIPRNSMFIVSGAPANGGGGKMP